MHKILDHDEGVVMNEWLDPLNAMKPIPIEDFLSSITGHTATARSQEIQPRFYLKDEEGTLSFSSLVSFVLLD